MNKRSPSWQKQLEVGARLTETCYNSYAQTATGLGPEVMEGSTLTSAAGMDAASYHLRPETVESIFYMWRATHDIKYREWGWKIAQVGNKRVHEVCSTSKNILLCRLWKHLLVPERDTAIWTMSIFLSPILIGKNHSF